jgi:1-deoxy-D-xylulose-5-phosphate reductoisomerase
MNAANAGEGACIAISSADEVLVDLYLKDKIKFSDFEKVLEKELAKFKKVGDVELDEVLSIDEQARKYTYSVLGIK